MSKHNGALTPATFTPVTYCKRSDTHPDSIENVVANSADQSDYLEDRGWIRETEFRAAQFKQQEIERQANIKAEQEAAVIRAKEQRLAAEAHHAAEEQRKAREAAEAELAAKQAAHQKKIAWLVDLAVSQRTPLENRRRDNTEQLIHIQRGLGQGVWGQEHDSQVQLALELRAESARALAKIQAIDTQLAADIEALNAERKF